MNKEKAQQICHDFSKSIVNLVDAFTADCVKTKVPEESKQVVVDLIGLSALAILVENFCTKPSKLDS